MWFRLTKLADIKLQRCRVGEYRIEVTSRGFQTPMQRWGISESDLPLGSVVLFREFTFWELYNWRILGVGALILLQTSLIAGLLIERARRSEAAHGLSESEERYRNVVQTQTELICRYLP